MNLPDSIQYKYHSVHWLEETMHGYILSITFGNAIDFHSMGLVKIAKKERDCVKKFKLAIIFFEKKVKGFRMLCV